MRTTDLSSRLASLCQIGEVINSSLVLDEVLNRVIDSLINVTGAERGAIMLLDGNGDLVVRAARYIDPETVSTARFQTSRSLVRDVALSGEPRLIRDALSDATYEGFESVAVHHLQSILCAPLKVRGEVRGVLYVDHRIVTGAFDVDDLELLTAFAGQAAVAIENARLYEELGRRERLRRELEIARSIQSSLMPSRLPSPPGFDLAASCSPAEAVGGDFYDAMVIDEGQVAIFLGDVSGKGVPAALLMGMVRTLLRSEMQRSPFIAQGVAHCNRVLYDDFSNTNMFATLVLGVLDPAQRTFRYVNCGHCEPLLRRGATGRIDPLPGDGLPLGILEDFETTERVVRLAPGDVLVLYSDGFSEARAASGELYGVGRLRQALSASSKRAANGIRDDIEGAIEEFAGAEAQSDDQTIVVVRAADDQTVVSLRAPDDQTVVGIRAVGG